MCPAFVSNSSSLPKRHRHPTLTLFFSLLLSSGRLDYVAKEIFFLSFFFFVLFSLFPIDLVLMRFECPLVCAERWGEEGSTGSCEWRNFNLRRLGGGLCGLRPKERHSSENWSGLQSWGTSWTATPPRPPPLFFRVTPSLAAHRCTVNLPLTYPKTKPWIKQTDLFIFALGEKILRLKFKHLQVNVTGFGVQLAAVTKKKSQRRWNGGKRLIVVV